MQELRAHVLSERPVQLKTNKQTPPNKTKQKNIVLGAGYQLPTSYYAIYHGDIKIRREVFSSNHGFYLAYL